MNVAKKLSLLTLILLLFSCISNEDITPGPQQDEYVTIRVKMPDIVMPQGSTRAITESDENKIDEIQLLIFEKDGTAEKFKSVVTITSAEITNASTGVNGSQKEFSIKLSRFTNPIRLVVLANISKTLIDSNIAVGDEKSAALKKLVGILDNKWPATASVLFKVFPMWGETADLLSDLSQKTYEVYLLRAVAKVDVGIDIYSGVSLGFGERFKLKEVYVCNVPNRYQLTPDMAHIQRDASGKVLPTQPHLVTTNPAYNDFTYAYSKFPSWTPDPLVLNDKQKLFSEIYIPENKHDAANNKRTFIVVSGLLDGGSQPTYFRIDFASGKSASTLIDVLRNYRYLVNIIGAKGPGFNTLAEAMTATVGSNLEVEITITDQITDIVYNAQYSLGVDKSKRLLDWEGLTSETIKVNTTYEGGWEATSSTPWIQFENAPGGLAIANGWKSTSYNTITTLIIKAQPNTTGADRTGTIDLKAGNLTQTLTIKQSVGSNAIVTIPGTTVNLPWSLANADGTTRIVEADINATNYGLVVLWKDNPSLVLTPTVSTAGFSLETPSDGEYGNAVVAIKKNSSGEILWSWHIWQVSGPADDPNNPNNWIERNGRTFMYANLGSFNVSGIWNGTMYQWGRKDPFPGTYMDASGKPIIYNAVGGQLTDGVDGIQYSTIPSPDLATAIKTPMMFYTNSTYGGNWITDGHNNYWNTVDGEKGIYDPCPFGWRVPTSGSGNLSPWNGFANTDITSGKYPLSGYLAAATGKLTDRTAFGYVTTATAFSFYHYLFGFHGGTIEPSNTNGSRADAYPVRCVKIED